VIAHKIDNARKKLISIESYLASKGVKPHHVPAMVVFAKPKRMATKENWDKLFERY